MNLGIASSGGVNFSQLEALKARNDKTIANVKTKVADAKAKAANAEVEQAEAQQAQAQAGQKQAMGGLTSGTGSAMIAVAGAMGAMGWATAGAGYAVALTLLLTGSAMVLAGAGITAVAMKEMADATNKGNEALEEAVANGSIADTQAAVLSKAMQTSNTIEMEKNMLKELMQKEKTENPDMSPEESAALEKTLKKAVEKGFEAGAKTIKDGGIATVESQNGEDRYFERKENGDIHEVSVKSDADGEPIYGPFGELQKDEDLGQIQQNDPDAVSALGVFAFEDQIRKHIEGGVPLYDDQGNVTERTDPISRLRINGDGSVTKENYDLNNPVHAAELYSLVMAAHQNPPPHKYYERERTNESGEIVKELGFETADGTFVSLDSLTTEETRDESLATLGFVPGDPRFDQLSAIVDNARESDAAASDPTYYSNMLKNAQQEALNSSPGGTGSSSFLDGSSSASNTAGTNRDDSNGLGSA